MRGIKGLIAVMVAVILALLLFPNQSFAQTQAEEITKIFSEEQTVITATKREQKISESPSAISVITAEDLADLGVTKLSEAFLMTPGVQFGYVTSAWQAAGGIRGFNRLPANKIMALINGMPQTYEVNQTPNFTTLPIALEEIERVEVLRGPGSSLYGPNAMFGVINIITKKPEDTKGNLVSLRAGEDGLFYTTYMHSGSIIDNKLAYRFTVNYDTRDNFGYLATTRDPADRSTRFNTSLGYAVDDNSRLDIFGSYVDEGRIYTLTAFPNFFKDEYVYYGNIRYTSKDPNISIRVYTDYNYFWDTGWSLGQRAFNYKMGTNGVDFQHIWEPLENDTFVWGTNFTQVLAEGPSLGGKRRHDMSGVFIDNTYKLRENFSINTGLRYDHHPNTGDNITHRLAFLYTPAENQHLRFTWGSSFRNPDFFESYGYYDLQAYPGLSPLDLGSLIRLKYSGNEALKAEKAETFEVGYMGKVGKKLDVEVNVFYTKLMDYIDNATTFSFPDLASTAVNYDNLYQFGTETQLSYPFCGWLSGVLSYTYLEQWGETPGASSNFLAQTPQHMFNAMLKSKFKNGITANLSLHYRGTTEWLRSGSFTITGDPSGRVTTIGGKTQDYVIANLNLGYKFKFMNNDTELRLAVFDLFDKEFDDYPVDTYSVGRRVSATLTYKF